MKIHSETFSILHSEGENSQAEFSDEEKKSNIILNEPAFAFSLEEQKKYQFIQSRLNNKLNKLFIKVGSGEKEFSGEVTKLDKFAVSLYQSPCKTTFEPWYSLTVEIPLEKITSIEVLDSAFPQRLVYECQNQKGKEKWLIGLNLKENKEIKQRSITGELVDATKEYQLQSQIKPIGFKIAEAGKAPQTYSLEDIEAISLNKIGAVGPMHANPLYLSTYSIKPK